MSTIRRPFYPIIYVRGYAMTQAEIEATAATTAAVPSRRSAAGASISLGGALLLPGALWVAARADLEQARELFARLDPEAYEERAVLEEALSHLKRNQGEVEAAQEHARASVAIGEQKMEATGEPAMLFNAKVSLAMSLFASDPAASEALFEEVLEALPAHGLEFADLASRATAIRHHHEERDRVHQRVATHEGPAAPAAAGRVERSGGTTRGWGREGSAHRLTFRGLGASGLSRRSTKNW